MPQTDRQFETWFAQKFANLGDRDIEAAFRKVARAAWEEGMRVSRDFRSGAPSRGDVANSQFADSDGHDRPDVPRVAQVPRSTSQFDDTDSRDRLDANRRQPGASQFSTDDDRRGYSQFSDGAITPR